MAFAILAAIFAVECEQAVTQPIRTSEAYLYDRFVRPTFRQVLADGRLNRDVLYAVLEKRSIGLWHVSRFSVRLPSLLFGLLYLWSAWRLGELLLGYGRWFVIAVAVAGLAPVQADCFARADGVGAALALQMCAAWQAIRYFRNDGLTGWNLNTCGLCLGLSAAARLDFAWPALGLGLVLLVALAARGQWIAWTERILAPAVVAALILLVLPLSHAQAAPENTTELTAGAAEHLEPVLYLLRLRAGTEPVRIAAAPEAEPIVNLYRAEYRLTNWSRASRDYRAGDFDYYLLRAADAGFVGDRHLIVLHRDADFVLARRGNAPI